MQPLHNFINLFQKFAPNLINFGIVTGLATITFGLISCGGGGGSGGGGSTTPTITKITPLGMVASSVAKTITLDGTNFATGMTLSISGSGVQAINIPNPTITALSISASATIDNVPSDNFVTVTLKSSTGTTLASTTMGVAGSRQTIAGNIQGIFDTYLCYQCHFAGATNGLNLYTATDSSTGLTATASSGCSNKIRVTPGDPRRTNSILIDVLKAKATGTASLSCNSKLSRHMPQSGAALTDPEIQQVVDWVAGGAY